MAGVRTSGIWMLRNTWLGRQIHRKSRASTSVYGHESSDWYAAQSVSPRRNRCTIWSSDSSSIGTSLGEQSDTESTDLKHLRSSMTAYGLNLLPPHQPTGCCSPNGSRFTASKQCPPSW